MTSPGETLSSSVANTQPVLQETVNPITRIKQFAGRMLLSLSLAVTGGLASGLATEMTDSRPAVAVVTDDYPDKEAPCVHIGEADFGKISDSGKWCDNYDWGYYTKDVNGNVTSTSTNSSRGYGYRNCTDWVVWRISQLGVGAVPKGWASGGNWDNAASNARYAVDTTPEEGDIAVWDPTSTNPFGHVEVVESVNADGTANTSGYNQATNGTFATRSNVTANHYIDLNGAGKGINGRDLGTGTAPPNVGDGTFLRVTDSGAIYRVVGGAPIRIYNQGVIPDFDGGQVVPISHAQLGQMPTYHKDEGDIISLVEAGGAKYRFVGGAPVRITNCAPLNNCAGAINVNFQSLVEHDHMRQRPKDGAAISIAEAGGSGIYRFVGGAPVRLFNWGAIPDLTNVVSVNEQSLATHDHMNTRPTDGSAISLAEAGGGGIYRFVGGAPIRLFNQGAIPDMPGVVTVNAHSLAVHDHMNERPADGSAINLVEAGGSGIYRFAGGAPLRLFNWGGIPGFGNAVNVNAQSLAVHDHMNSLPANGEFIASAETGAVYRVAGGAALRLYNHGGIPGYNGAVFVNQQTLDSLDHLLASPNNGTILRGVSSGTYWQINSGERTQVGPNGNAITVDEQTINAFPID